MIVDIAHRAPADHNGRGKGGFMANVLKASSVMLAFLAGACVKVGHIQQTEPVAALRFSGSHKFVAQCVKERLAANVQEESFGERYVLYGAVKGMAAEGLTHYAITIRRTDTAAGMAEWRIMKPPRHRGPHRVQQADLSPNAVREFWAPVEQCAARASAQPAS